MAGQASLSRARPLCEAIRRFISGPLPVLGYSSNIGLYNFIVEQMQGPDSADVWWQNVVRCHTEIQGERAYARSESLARPKSWPTDGDLSMFTDRRIERHQLTCFLQVFNRITDKPIGFLGNVSQDGLMLISQLPMMVGVDFELRLKLPEADGSFRPIDITASCLWSREDINPQYYDSGFSVLEASEDYKQLISALLHYFSFDPLRALSG